MTVTTTTTKEITTMNNVTTDRRAAIKTYRAIRDQYLEACVKYRTLVRRIDAGEDFDITEAADANWRAWDDLYMKRCDLWDQGINVSQIDDRDGFTDVDPERTA